MKKPAAEKEEEKVPEGKKIPKVNQKGNELRKIHIGWSPEVSILLFFI